jgi:hypothetical protein
LLPHSVLVLWPYSSILRASLSSSSIPLLTLGLYTPLVSTLVWINHRVLRIPIHTLSVGKLLHFRRFSAASFLFEIIDELNLEPIMVRSYLYSCFSSYSCDT